MSDLDNQEDIKEEEKYIPPNLTFSRSLDRMLNKIRDKLAMNAYFSVEDWKKEMKRFLEASNSQVQTAPGAEKASDRLLSKFNDLCEEHNMNLSLP